MLTLLLFPALLRAQCPVTQLGAVVSASGSGVGSVPALSYQPPANSYGIMILTVIVERDHTYNYPASLGHNFATADTSATMIPPVSFGGRAMTRRMWNNGYRTGSGYTDTYFAYAAHSFSIYTYVLYDPPSGSTQSFDFSAWQTALSPGDEWMATAVTYDNVEITEAPWNYGLSSFSSQSPASFNSMVSAISANQPTGTATTDNLIYSPMAVSAQTIAGSNQTVLFSSAVDNTAGTFASYSPASSLGTENDGISMVVRTATGIADSTSFDQTWSGTNPTFFTRQALRLVAGCPPVVTPVTFKEFRAEVLPACKGVQLYWSTATELNSKYFVVERSRNGKEWTAIGRVAAAGSSTEERRYSYTDAGAPSGNNLYRLRQQDFDGKESFSRSISVQISCADQPCRMYPNPVRDELHIEAPQGGTRSISIFDMMGRQMGSFSMEPGSRRSITTGQWPAGTYLLRIGSEDGSSTTTRISKQ